MTITEKHDLITDDTITIGSINSIGSIEERKALKRLRQAKQFTARSNRATQEMPQSATDTERFAAEDRAVKDSENYMLEIDKFEKLLRISNYDAVTIANKIRVK